VADAPTTAGGRRRRYKVDGAREAIWRPDMSVIVEDIYVKVYTESLVDAMNFLLHQAGPK